MGTYRQPSQLIDKSFEKLNQSFAQLGQQMQAQLAAKQKAKLQAAQDAAKKRDREYAAFDKKRDKAVMDYQVKIDNWEHINQERGEDWEAEDVTIENQLKDNANHYLDIMGSAQEDSAEYRAAERALRNMIEQYPTMAGLLNQESEELAGAYNPTGEDRLADDKAGAVLLSNDPLASTKTHMLHDIKFSRHPERFKIMTGPTGVTMTYNDPDTGETFTLDAAEYKMYKEGGNDLVGVTNEEDFNKFMDGVWDIAGNDYKPFKEKLMQYRKDKASGKDVKITEVTKTYDRANATLKANIEKYVKGNGTITQSQWQLMGGSKIPGMEVYDPANEEMQQKAIDLLYEKQLDKYGKDAENNFTAQELKQSKIEVDEKFEAYKTGGFETKNVPGLTGGTHSYTEVKDAYTNAPDKNAYAVALINDAMNQRGVNGVYLTGTQLIQKAKDEGMEGDDLKEFEANVQAQGGANAIFKPDGNKGYDVQDINTWSDVRGRLSKDGGFEMNAMQKLDGDITPEEKTPFKIIDLSQRQGGQAAPIKKEMTKPEEKPEVKDGTVVDTTEKVEEKVQDADVDEVFGVEEEATERDLKSENKKQEDLMRNSEVQYGGKSGDNTVGLPQYKDFDFQVYLNSEEPVSDDPKTGFYGKSKHPKRGLKVDLTPEVYDNLSDGQQAMMRMQHVNIPWDPRVVMLISTGVIPRDKRKEYLEDWEATTKLYDENKEKFKSIDDQEMFDEWVDIYANTEPNDKGFQKQYKRRAEDMAKAYGYKLTDEQKKKFKI